MFNINLLSADLVSDWFANSIPVIRDILLILIGLCAVIIVFAILFQTSTSSDASAITGGSESFYSQNKGSSIEDKLNRLTKICAIVMIVLIVLYFVSKIIYHG